MNFIELCVQKWQELVEKATPVLHKIVFVLKKADEILSLIWTYIWKLRRVFAAVPVAVAAVMLALRNMIVLPAVVGLDLQTDGTFAIQLSREVAVLGPVALTAVCLLLMFCSKRILTPWVVSVISLIVPIFIWAINIFPT